MVLASPIPAAYSRKVEEGEDMAVVQVMGTGTQAGGLKESLAKFRKHQAEEGDQVLNISGIDTITGGPVDKDDPRPPYVRVQYPVMLYHAEKLPQVGNCEPGQAVAETEEEAKALIAKGYRTTPYIRPQAAIADPAVEKALLQKQLSEKDGEIATLADKQAGLERQLDELRAMIHAADTKAKKN